MGTNWVPLNVTVTVRDEHGNLVGTGGAAVTLSTTLGTLSGDVTDHGDGTYTQTLTAGTVAGDAVITGTLNGAAIDDDALGVVRTDSSRAIREHLAQRHRRFVVEIGTVGAHCVAHDLPPARKIVCRRHRPA